MANTKVTIKVVAHDVNEVYVVGSTKAFGEWNPKKAVKLEFCNECKAYTASKMIPVGEAVEFKVLADKDWASVEKGANGEEVENHSFVASKGLVVETEVLNFNK